MDLEIHSFIYLTREILHVRNRNRTIVYPLKEVFKVMILHSYIYSKF